MTEHLAWLARSEPNLVRVGELARSQEQRTVWMVEIGAGSADDRITRPALLVVAGIEGNDLVGPFAVLSWIDRLVAQYREGSPTADLLNTTTVYVVPCLNPDATEGFFAASKIERNTNQIGRASCRERV
jgi:predicted deacylase